jgi:hypothetical protein
VGVKNGDSRLPVPANSLFSKFVDDRPIPAIAARKCLLYVLPARIYRQVCPAELDPKDPGLQWSPTPEAPAYSIQIWWSRKAGRSLDFLRRVSINSMSFCRPIGFIATGGRSTLNGER